MQDVTGKLAQHMHPKRQTVQQTLVRRTSELAAANRRLVKEVVTRKRVTVSLRQSERHTRLLLRQSQRQQEQLRRLSRRVLSAQEDERKRISRELHDVIAQMLTAINLRLATLNKEATANIGGFQQKIAHAQQGHFICFGRTGA